MTHPLATQTQQAQPTRQATGGAGSVHHQADFNGDGCADLAVGVQDTRLGSAIGPRRGALGHAITAGDFNGDQYVDLAAGAPGPDLPFDLPFPNAPGQVLLSRGSAAGLERGGCSKQQTSRAMICNLSAVRWSKVR